MPFARVRGRAEHLARAAAHGIDDGRPGREAREHLLRPIREAEVRGVVGELGRGRERDEAVRAPRLRRVRRADGLVADVPISRLRRRPPRD